MFVMLFLLNACAIWHVNKDADGSYDASHYSVGMDRKDVNIAAPDGTSIVIGESNSSSTTEKVVEGLRKLADELE